VLALSYQQAEAKARAWFQIAVSKANGESVRSGQFTVVDALKDYLSHCKRRGLKAVEPLQGLLWDCQTLENPGKTDRG
jgi:predicted YcjX-like family ATPase